MHTSSISRHRFDHLKKVVSVAVAVGSVALMTAACSSKTSASTTSKISVAIASDLQTLDPAHCIETTSGEVINNTEEGLITIGQNNKVEPGIAKSWTKSADGKTYTFNIRKDAHWADGTPITAKTFVYSWQREVNPKTAAENAYRFSGIVNADAITSSKKDVSTLGVTADGNYKLVVKMDHPMATFEQMLGNAEFMPVEKKMVEKYGDKYGTDSTKVGYSGPYTVKKWNGSGDSWTLVKNNKYWNKGNIHIDDVTYQVVKEATTGLNMFESGQLDQTTLIGNQVQNEKNNKDFKQVKSGANYFVQVNQKSPSSDMAKKAFNNVYIRKALSLAINRKEFVNNVLNDGSTVPLGVVTQGISSYKGKDFAQAAYNKNTADSGVSYDKKLAQDYWDKGMKQISATSLDLTVTADDDDTHDSIVQYLQNTWTKNLKGLKLTIKKVPKATRVKYLQSGNFDIIVSGWSPDADPASFLDMFKTGNSYNFGDWSNATYDNDMNTAETTADDNTRWNKMIDAEQILMKDQGVIPLYQLSTTYLRNTKIKNYVDNPAGGNPGWRGVYLADK